MPALTKAGLESRRSTYEIGISHEPILGARKTALLGSRRPEVAVEALLGREEAITTIGCSAMSHTSSFDIVTAGDFFNKVVLEEYSDFVAHNASSRHALLTIIVAYHMFDWVNGSKFTLECFEKKYGKDSALADVFELARNIANGTKHFAQRAKTHTQAGFSSGFSDEFARPLEVEFPDGSKKSADMFLREMIEFWKLREQEGDF